MHCRKQSLISSCGGWGFPSGVLELLQDTFVCLPSVKQPLLHRSPWTQRRQRCFEPKDNESIQLVTLRRCRNTDNQQTCKHASGHRVSPTWKYKKSNETTMEIPAPMTTCSSHVMYLCEWLLAVVLQVLGVDVEVIVVDGERLRTFGYIRHKLLHFEEDAALLAEFKLLHRNVGWGNTIYTQKQGRERDQINSLLQKTQTMGSDWLPRASFDDLLVKSGATLSMVTSRFPRITGSLAIFSGLREGKTNSG